MSRFIVRCIITRSIVVDADDEEAALQSAPAAEDLDEWDDNNVEWETEETSEEDDDEEDLSL